MDEPTSAMDGQTETLFMASDQKEMRGVPDRGDTSLIVVGVGQSRDRAWTTAS